jgi:hypothetical protein
VGAALRQDLATGAMGAMLAAKAARVETLEALV